MKLISGFIIVCFLSTGNSLSASSVHSRPSSINSESIGKMGKSEIIALKSYPTSSGLKTISSKDGIESINSITVVADSTLSAGTWSTAGNWSAGVPGNVSVNVNHAMTWDGSKTWSSGAVYTINAPVTDLPGGTAYNLAINGGAILTLNADMTIEGTFNPTNASTTITVKSGHTLTVGSITMGSSGSPSITVEDGAFLIVNGNFTASNSSSLVINGTVTVNGNFTSNGTTTVTGNGTINTTGTGTITSNGTSIFGQTNDCATGPCSTDNLCGFTNTVSTTASSTCSGVAPAAAITGTTNAASPVYLWEASTTSQYSGYTTATGTSNASSYSPPAITQTTWFKRSVIASGCTARAVQPITVTAAPSAPSVTPGSRCGTGTVALSASGSPSTYNWYAASSGGSSLATTASYTTASISATTTYYVTAVSGGCESTPRTSVVATVSATPTVSGTTPGSRCGTGTVALGATASAGTLNWYAASSGGSSLGTGTSYTTSSISSTTTYYVDATNGGCTSARSSVVATVTTTPSVSGTTPGSGCGTGTVGLGATASAGTLNWYAASSGGSSLGTGTSYTTPSISTTTTYYVDATNGGCTSARSSVVATVNTIPTVSGTTPASRCGTGTVGLGATASAGTLNWYAASSGGSSLGTGTSYTTSSISTTTTYYVDATNGGCTSARSSVVATVNTTPTVSSTTPGSRCVTGTVALGATASAGTLNWYAASSGGSSLATGTSYTTPSISTTTTYYVDATNAGCTSARSSVVATVNALPTPTISAGSTTTFCTGCSVTLTSSAASAYSWSTTATTSSIVVSTTGSYTVTVTDANGCQGTSSATAVTVNPCVGHTWTGATSSNWATASNWNKCAAPGTTDDVTIPNVATAPVISATANCRNLTINASASLTINSGNTLNIYGNITNNNTYTDNGTTVLTGSTAQTVTGAISFNNLTLANAAGATLNNATTVNGILTLTSGTLASGGNLTVNLNTGAIAGTGSGAISGNISTLKTVSTANYHYVSCPLSGLTVNDWNDDIQIKSGRYANLYSYDETNTDTSISVGWTAQTSLAAPLTSLKGFALYFYGSTSLDQTGTYTHSATYTSPTLTNTVSTIGGTHNAASDGWNLVGNPYPSAINWNAGGWTKTGLDSAIYFWDPVNSRYASYVTGSGTNGGTRYIPSMQAFWVRVTSPGTGSLAMTNSVRVTSTNPAIWRTAAASKILKLTASSGSFSDETIIRFREDAQEIFDSQLDAYKMTNEDNTPNLYTELHNDQYSINSLPDTSKKISIPVKLNAAFTGAYTFIAEETGSFDAEDSIIFEDRLLGIKQDLRANAAYTCSVTKGDTSGRFYINFRKASTQANFNTPVVPSMTVNSFDENIKIKFFNESSNTAAIGIYNTLGQEEFKIEDADITNKEYSILLSKVRSGVYIVKVITGSQSHSGKVYLFK